MLNYIWLGLVLAAVLIGGYHEIIGAPSGTLKEVTEKAFEMAKAAVMDIALPLAGIMALWLGVMRLAERAGLIQILARLLRPILRRLFPDVPPEHPAMGAMVMNIAANMLGLSNAATPLGLRAMKDLESLNRRPGVATNAMCTFLAINTSSVQLVPATAIGVLAVSGSTNPSAIAGTAFLATLCAAAAAIASVKFLEKLPWYQLPPVESDVPPGGKNAVETKQAGNSTGNPGGKMPSSTAGETVAATPIAPLNWFGVIVILLFVACVVWAFLRVGFPEIFGLNASVEFQSNNLFVRAVKTLSLLSIPFLLSFFPLYAALRRVKVYEEFVEGAKEGFQISLRIIPFLVAILVAIGMFRAAGGIELIAQKLQPVLNFVHFPTDLLPMCLVRPLSGTGTLGLFTELVKAHGPDSLIARTAGTIYGSTETTFYVVAVYFGAVGVRRTRHAVPAGLFADLVGIVASVIICRHVFG
jgi:spore maturation protein SpmA